MRQAVSHQDERQSQTLAFLMRSFEAVLLDLGETEVAARLPWRENWGKGEIPDTVPDSELTLRMAQAYSISFQFLTQSEENAAAQHRRVAENEERLAEDAGSWDQHFTRLRAQGFTEKQIADTLANVRVEPVLTAHPTEAKRQTVLQHHRALYRAIVDLENTMWTQSERQALEARARACIEKIWRTGEIFIEKPAVEDERRNILHYLSHAFPETLPWVDSRLRAAWDRQGFDADRLSLPRLAFGNWVGGDRDGHPFVVEETTRETLQLLREAALHLMRDALIELGEMLSLSERLQKTPAKLIKWIASRAEELGPLGALALDRNPVEAFRQAANLLLAGLPDVTAHPRQGQYRDAKSLLADLAVLRQALVDVGAKRLAQDVLDPIARKVETFGFHLARLDIRQNSDFHDRALGQMMNKVGEPDALAFPDWSDERRQQMIMRELDTLRPFSSGGQSFGEEADKVVGALRVFTEHAEHHGTEGLGSLIVSMTRSAEDLFAVFLFAREAGLIRQDAGAQWCPVPVAPLLETIEDLERGAEILDCFLDAPIVQRSLTKQAEAEGLDMPIQHVMVGYSDSGKDGGFVASVWTLYRSQLAMAEMGRKKGVKIRFFHGRGGTIGRGAGPTHRFLRALPPGTVQHGLRVTEQGETISQKFANRVTGAHQMEMMLAGVMNASLEQRKDPPELIAAMDQISADGRAAYEALVQSDGFLTFFGTATPIDAIEHGRIGSRPARRSGKRTLEDLRAIPWVFAWNQARFGIPGWYGVGSALEAMQSSDPATFKALIKAKTEDHRWAPYHYLISNAATAWAAASPQIMARYSAFTEDDTLRERMMGQILEEYERTGAMLSAMYGAPLAEARPRIQETIDRRNQALEPLHTRQISLLREWRRLGDAERTEKADALLSEVLLSVNAIASGLGGTG